MTGHSGGPTLNSIVITRGEGEGGAVCIFFKKYCYLPYTYLYSTNGYYGYTNHFDPINSLMKIKNEV